MSVNITVNGKFAKHCRSNPLLIDAQEVRKAEENERRKLRLLEVREESKKLAKKIRDEVNAEKRRELQKLQATKEKELEIWKEHALQRKNEDYRYAIFQVGTAHRAAKDENRKQYQQQPGCHKDFKKKTITRNYRPEKVQFNDKNSIFCPCQKTIPVANIQFQCTCNHADERSAKNEPEVTSKRKRNFIYSSSESESEGKDLENQSLSLSSTCDSMSNNRDTQTSTFAPVTHKCFMKNHSVCVEVEVGTDDDLTISAPAETADKHAECNRQFKSVIKVSPRKTQKQKENNYEVSTKQQSSSLSSDAAESKQNENKIPSENINTVSKDKRFTIISELVKKQKQFEPVVVAKNYVFCPPNTETASANLVPNISSNKQPKEISSRPQVVRIEPKSPRKASATSKSSRTVTTQPLTSFTPTTKSNPTVMSTSSNSGRVQFYDYNSKLTKEEHRASKLVNVQRQSDQNQLSAMEQAELENQREKKRQLEALKKFQLMEERGQKALEREQVRRDCNELTEKLQDLIREYGNQFPINDNQLHIFADKQLRKEDKMNSAIEKLIQRPSIITCSEQHKSNKQESKHKSPPNQFNTINVASLNNKLLAVDDLSSDSCCSILLGYVDDQSKIIKQDLKKTNSSLNQSKKTRLQYLLDRLDQLRMSLIKELRNESDKNEKEKEKIFSKTENVRQAMETLSDMGKQYADISFKDETDHQKLLTERERDLDAKESLLDKKVREFYRVERQHQLQKPTAKKDIKQSISEKENENENIDLTRSKDKDQNLKTNSINKKNVISASSNENPLEIIITIKGEAKSVKIPKTKRKISLKRSPSKLATLIRSPLPSSTGKKHISKRKHQITKPLGESEVLRRQNSYDSNSTSYLSLPSEIPTKIDHLAKCVTKKNLEQPNKLFTESERVKQILTHDEENKSETSLDSVNSTLKTNPQPYVNPLIAQYVNRLLGMSRKAVHKLGVSTSDIETPTSSIINTSDNVYNSDTIISDERLITLNQFIEENKSFITDLEQSIRLKNNVSFENSMRILDDMWRKRLKRGNVECRKSKKPQDPDKTQADKLPTRRKTKQNSLKAKEKRSSKHDNVQKIECKSTMTDHLSKSASSHYSTDEKEPTSTQNCKRPVETFDKAINAKLSTDSSKNEQDSQIVRYAKLTENCTHRIAELTELINRVREEKQRILEVTLSSVSDNGRQSTEYFELPEGKSGIRNEQDDVTHVSSSSEETTRKKLSCSDTLHEITKLSLDYKKNQIANSQDSGIAESRPLTALENRIEQEPLSYTSSESAMAQSIRKMKPPPTLKRFSPQLPEDELAHELSTILEVDTPATSRINTCAGQPNEDKDNAPNNNLQHPLKFPTFEEYIKQLNLDITQLGPERNIQLQQEFAIFLNCLQKSHPREESPKYFEFPSINAYIEQLAEGDICLGETGEESLTKLYITGINPRNFPALREYINNNTSKSLPSDEQQLLDTDSLENITDEQIRSNTDNDTASLDIEKELIKRKILKKSFRVKKQENFYQEILAAESGLDKLSTSGNTSDLLDNDLRQIIQQSPEELDKKLKEKKMFSTSGTSSSKNISALANSALRAASSDRNSTGSGRVFNLRDFLTRELQKRANSSASTTNCSSDESLRNNFLHSLIGSLTPLTGAATSKSGAQTLERQKTSTPVLMQSLKTHSNSSNSSNINSSNQLFSGESRISSVHYNDRSDHSSE